MTIPNEVHEQARALYVADGLTFAEVAAETGIAESTLKRWSAKEGWRESKENQVTASQKALDDFHYARCALPRLLRSAISKEEAKLQKQGAGVSPKVLSAVARLAEVTALYFQHPDTGGSHDRQS